MQQASGTCLSTHVSTASSRTHFCWDDTDHGVAYGCPLPQDQNPPGLPGYVDYVSAGIPRGFN